MKSRLAQSYVQLFNISVIFNLLLFVLIVFGIGAFPFPMTPVFAQDNRVEITGTFHIIWIDHEDGTAEARYILVDTLGQWTDLELPDAAANRPEGFLGLVQFLEVQLDGGQHQLHRPG